MQNILRISEPSSVELLGERIPLFFSLRAAARMEEALEMDYPTILNRLYENETGEAPDKKTGIAPRHKALPLPDQAMVAAIVIVEGEERLRRLDPGESWQDAAADRCNWMLGLHMEDYNLLALAVTREIAYKTRFGQIKNE